MTVIQIIIIDQFISIRPVYSIIHRLLPCHMISYKFTV